MSLDRLAGTLFLASLALLPWSWFPPFPWLHRHAQWSDLLFAAAAAAWAADRIRRKRLPVLRPVHLAIGAYLAAAVLSRLFSPAGESAKLLGMFALGGMAVVTSAVAADPAMRSAILRVLLFTSLLSAAAALGGLGLYYAGLVTPLLGTYGDLQPSEGYARVQGGFYHPNLLGSYLIFAGALLAGARLPAGIGRSAAWLLLTLALAATFSRAAIGFAAAACLRSDRVRRSPRAAAAVVGAALALLGALTAGNLQLDPTRPLEARLAPAISSRWESLTTALHTAAERPLLGSGPGTAPGHRAGVPVDAHCTPVNVAATLGVPALTAFLALFALLWRHRPRPTDVPLWAGLAGLALDGLTQDIEDYRHLWVLIGLLDSRPERGHDSA